MTAGHCFHISKQNVMINNIWL